MTNYSWNYNLTQNARVSSMTRGLGSKPGGLYTDMMQIDK